MLKLMMPVLLSSLASTTTPTPSGLPFIADDVPAARTEAARSRRPLFVEVWAPW